MHYIDVRYVFDTYVFDHGNLAIVYKGLILYCTYRWKYLHKYTDSLVNINFQKSIISIHKLCTCRQPESCWNSLKLGQKTRRRKRREDLQSYLEEQMWRRWRAGTAQQSMQNFLAVVANQYLVDNPVL